jgi:hypothetical protein
MKKCVFIACIFCVLSVPGFGAVSVSSPGNGSSLQSPVHFVATSSSACSSGVASMGVYTSPGVLSYVVKGSKLDTNVSLGLGTHAVEVKEWDNCGGSSGSTVTVTIQGNVSVTSPSANSTVSSPVHFVASAGSSCSKGVASIGIYTAPFQRAYLTDGSKLDTQLSLSPGTYNTVIQSWDKCGGTSTKPVTITVGNSSSGGNVATGTSGSAVKVSVPAPNSTVSSPVHYVATATTSCAKGVAAMGIYVNNSLVTTLPGASLDTSISVGSGGHNTVVQSWDKCGGTAKAAVPVTVNSSPGKTFYNLQNNTAWKSFGELAPKYDICSDCSPKVTWGTQHGVSSPSLSGSSMKTSLGGTVPYSDALWYNQLIGDFSTQGLPDVNKTLVPTFHHFIYDVYFFGTNVELAEAIEFDINHFTAGRGYIYGTECRIVSGHVWAIWDNPHNRWINTPIACHPKSNEWNHLVIEVERTTDNKLLYKSITLNGNKQTLNWYNDSTPNGWHGVTVNFQIDGNYKQQPFSIYLDKFNFTYY